MQPFVEAGHLWKEISDSTRVSGQKNIALFPAQIKNKNKSHAGGGGLYVCDLRYWGIFFAVSRFPDLFFAVLRFQQNCCGLRFWPHLCAVLRYEDIFVAVLRYEDILNAVLRYKDILNKKQNDHRLHSFGQITSEILYLIFSHHSHKYTITLYISIINRV